MSHPLSREAERVLFYLADRYTLTQRDWEHLGLAYFIDPRLDDRDHHYPPARSRYVIKTVPPSLLRRGLIAHTATDLQGQPVYTITEAGRHALQHQVLARAFNQP